MLLLHGYLSSKEAFAAQIEYFSKYFRVTAFDFLGQGKSAPLKTPFSVGEYAAWTKEVMCGLEVYKPHVIAHSFGCRVAVKMAAADNALVDKMVLTGAAGVILKRPLRYKIKVKTYRAVKKFFPRFAERKFGSEEYRSLSPLMKESYKKIVNEDLRTEARRVQNPVLLIQGRGDTTTPLKEAEAYLKAFPNANLKIMDGGHFAFAENPPVFHLITEEFLYD